MGNVTNLSYNLLKTEYNITTNQKYEAPNDLPNPNFLIPISL